MEKFVLKIQLKVDSTLIGVESNIEHYCESLRKANEYSFPKALKNITNAQTEMRISEVLLYLNACWQSVIKRKTLATMV